MKELIIASIILCVLVLLGGYKRSLEPQFQLRAVRTGNSTGIRVVRMVDGVAHESPIYIFEMQPINEFIRVRAINEHEGEVIYTKNGEEIKRKFMISGDAIAYL